MNSDTGRHDPSHVANQDAANDLKNKKCFTIFGISKDVQEV